ncbi:MAG: osmoprotectant transport system substrate-binding protein [Actinomycetota bacterium]|jgi:osmoprotectant transport system substrate-binding protein|nr:osmoprotectant transport system substrate-binding protein [Actinomycetota bacterium]
MRSRTGILLAATTAAALSLTACGGSSTSTSSGTLTNPSQGATSSAGDELVVLADDLHLQTVDNVVPVVNAKVDSPALEQALNNVTKVLTTADLVTLNKGADVERKSPATLAKAYVDDKQLATGVTGGSGKVVVGGANFSESQILANIFADVLKAAGFDASVKPVTNREVYEPALERGDVQVMPEYVGTLTEFLNKKANGPSAAPQASTDLAATVTALRALADKKGLKVLDAAAGAADQNAFAVTKNFADANGLHQLSDLKNYKGKLVLGGPPECPTRPFCQLGLEKTYGLTFASFLSLDAGGPLVKAALKQGKVQLGLVFSSDGSLTPSS